MINPNGMELKPWADATMLVLNSLTSVSVLESDDWQPWGALIAQSPQLGKFNVPDPYQYAEWSDWALALYSSLNSVSQ